jgi:acyl-CoA reductase-like NAD-dependent aldehyde dehydrogenase
VSAVNFPIAIPAWKLAPAIAPFGGMRQSSSGSREQSKVARDFFTQWKTVYLDAPPAE